jgi:hypothetical protein
MNKAQGEVHKLLELEELSLPEGVASRIDGLRLVEEGGALSLLYSTTGRARQPSGMFEFEMVISAVPLATSTRPAERFRVPLLFAGAPDWDSDGKALVFTANTGAGVQLILQGGDATLLREQGPFDAHAAPRLVRGGGGAVTAAEGAPRRWLLFRQPGGKSEPLGAADEGVLLRRDFGYCELSKASAEGPPRGPQIAPGRLRLRFRSPELAELGEGLAHGGAIYQLDAAMLGPAHLAALATTAAGASLLLLRAAPGLAALDAERVWPGPVLAFPTTCAQGTALTVAAVVHHNTPAARVLHGRVALAELLGR